MAVISTKQLFDEFFAQKDETTSKKTRSQFDRPEVYAYELKINKQMVDMNANELFDMIMSFKNNNRKDNSDYVIPYSSYVHLLSGYRAIFNFYIDNYELIKNPFYDKSMRGMYAAERVAGLRQSFTMEIFDKAVSQLYATCDQDRAKYIEIIMRLFLDGIATPDEIVDLKEDMINFETREIYLDRTTVNMSSRTAELLKWVHKSEILEGTRGNFFMASWNKGYFKYPIHASRAADFNERNRVDVTRTLVRFIKSYVKPINGVVINYRSIYMLGFYTKLCERYSTEKTRELILSVRNSNDADMLMSFAKEYGVSASNVTWIKKELSAFI